VIPTQPITKRDLLTLTTLRVGFIKKNLMIGDNVTDYVCVQTWDPIFECMRYHWVHKSEEDPVQFVKNLNPEQKVL
tara:strand:- start:856 stop:1083 length:228 start_codon:yes stop_codon:yes gene_type:complete